MVSKCADLQETSEVIAKVGFKMFLGVSANVGNWGQEDSEFSLYLDDNPLVDFVELPEDLRSVCICCLVLFLLCSQPSWVLAHSLARVSH